MRSPHAATAIAVGLIAAGVVLMVLGWEGLADTLFVPTQVAFAVSGGMAGIAVLGVGLAVLGVQTTRLATARRSRQLRHLVADSVDVLAAVRRRTSNGTQPLRRGPIAPPKSEPAEQ